MYQTDDRGVYRIYGLLAGKYKVSVGPLKKAVTLKPCEEIADFALSYVAPASP
jgi:hypothetical protein